MSRCFINLQVPYIELFLSNYANYTFMKISKTYSLIIYQAVLLRKYKLYYYSFRIKKYISETPVWRKYLRNLLEKDFPASSLTLYIGVVFLGNLHLL